MATLIHDWSASEYIVGLTETELDNLKEVLTGIVEGGEPSIEDRAFLSNLCWELNGGKR